MFRVCGSSFGDLDSSGLALQPWDWQGLAREVKSSAAVRATAWQHCLAGASCRLCASKLPAIALRVSKACKRKKRLARAKGKHTLNALPTTTQLMPRLLLAPSAQRSRRVRAWGPR